MAVQCGPDDVQQGRDVQEGRDVRAEPRTYGYIQVTSPEALQWLNDCCGLRWQNMSPLDLELALSPQFLPHVDKGGNPIEDATVCEGVK